LSLSIRKKTAAAERTKAAQIKTNKFSSPYKQQLLLAFKQSEKMKRKNVHV
jgi:hypothetical protein